MYAYKCSYSRLVIVLDYNFELGFKSSQFKGILFRIWGCFSVTLMGTDKFNDSVREREGEREQVCVLYIKMNRSTEIYIF